MDNFISTTFRSRTSNYSNISIDNIQEVVDSVFTMHVATCVIIAIGLPLTLLAIYGLYSLVRNDNHAPIFVINLLISDVIQFCSLIVREVADQNDRTSSLSTISHWIHIYGLEVSVAFMVCVALERYLVIVFPLWYRVRRTIKKSVVICVLVWIFCLVPVIINSILLTSGLVEIKVTLIIWTVYLLLPLPLLIFFPVGTLRALSASISVPSEEKRIVGTLVLVLLIYTLLFLPFIIWGLSTEFDNSLPNLSFMFFKLSPLADLVLYIFMRKGIIDMLLARLCCCRMESR